MKKITQLYILCGLMAITACNSKTKPAGGISKSEKSLIELINFDIRSVIDSADIYRTARPDSSVINLYQGNGRFGCSYGPMGLHVPPEKSGELPKYGNTQYMHIKHFVRAKFGSDFLLPLARIYWKEEPKEVNNYEQHQSFYDGTITTHFEYSKNKATVTTWFDPVERDMTGLRINVDGNAPGIIIDPFEKLKVHYNQEIAQVSAISYDSGLWKIDLSCLNKTSSLFLKTNVETRIEGNRLLLNLHQGENTILISVNQQARIIPGQSLDRTIKWWHSKWNNSGCLALPDAHAQKMWVHSMAYILSAFNDDKSGFAPSMGFTGNGWPFNFPQDVSYILPVLLSTGNFDIAKSMIEYCAERIPGMKRYTRRLLNVEGILCPWVFPYDDFNGYHDPVPPNKFYYEIHNSGYLARMAYETAIFVNDENWTRKYAIPLVKETAAFYKSICFKGTDGLWHLSVKPSMGQDEMGGFNQDDYLCALFSAKYCFQKALDYNLDSDGSYSTILREGLAFSSLISKNGFYFTCHGSGDADFGKQKHPVQLNDLAFLPVNPEVINPSSIAYNLRYEITQDAKKPFFYGWTLGEFLLAGSRIGNVEDWRKDWDNLRKSDYIDPDWIQVYESSGAHSASFYFASNGLIAQSLLNNLVSDWYGKLDIAKCNPWKGKVFLKNIYSLLGVKISGEINNYSTTLCLTAWKDSEFELHGEKIKMKKNELRIIKLNLRNN